MRAHACSHRQNPRLRKTLQGGASPVLPLRTPQVGLAHRGETLESQRQSRDLAKTHSVEAQCPFQKAKTDVQITARDRKDFGAWIAKAGPGHLLRQERQGKRGLGGAPERRWVGVSEAGWARAVKTWPGMWDGEGGGRQGSNYGGKGGREDAGGTVYLTPHC